MSNGGIQGVAPIALPHWSVAGDAVAFDEYEGWLGLKASRLLEALLRGIHALARLHRLKLASVSPAILVDTVKLVLKHHIYSADALQVASTRHAGLSSLVTADREPASITALEGLGVIEAVGPPGAGGAPL